MHLNTFPLHDKKNLNKIEFFVKYEIKRGKDLFCLNNAVADNHIVSERELDNYVDMATAGRYAGHLAIDD